MKTKLLIYCFLFLPLFFYLNPANPQNIADFLVNEQTGIDGSEQSTPDIEGDGNGNSAWFSARNIVTLKLSKPFQQSDNHKI